VNGGVLIVVLSLFLSLNPLRTNHYAGIATDIMPDRVGTRTWDTMYAAKLDLMRGKRMGRLLEYDPNTHQVRVLAKNLWFANGIGVDKDESYIFMAETFALQLVKYHLTGPKANTVEVVVESHQMAGFPDGADCAIVGRKTKCFAVMPSAMVPLVKLIHKVPYPFDKYLRNLVMALPKKMAPKIKPYGGIIQVDPDTNEIQYFQDPNALDIGHLAGVTVRKNSLYLGSLKNNFVGVYDLS